METGARCGCNHSLAVICGVFAGIAVALFLAEDRCLDAGGRVSDTAWSCQPASGAVSSLWGLVTPGVAAVAILVGIAVYFAASVFGRRWLFRYGNIAAGKAFESGRAPAQREP
jgi:presenilin-like A22 family membrane protease